VGEYLGRGVVSLLLGALGFMAARYFQLEPLVALMIGAAAAAGTFVSGALDFVKKILDIRKTKLEVARLKAEEAEREEKSRSVIWRPTAEETKKYGASIAERKLEIRLRLEEEKERLEATDIVRKLSEKRM
jgi:hypothetical protein